MPRPDRVMPETERITPMREAVMDPLESLRTLLVVQERVVADRLASLLRAAEGHAAAERVLAGIAIDTIGERDEVEGLVADWARARGEDVPPPQVERLDLRDLLLSLLEVKRSSARRYRRAAEAAPDKSMKGRLQHLATQAAEHAAILLGLVADIDAREPAGRHRSSAR